MLRIRGFSLRPWNVRMESLDQSYFKDFTGCYFKDRLDNSKGEPKEDNFKRTTHPGMQ